MKATKTGKTAAAGKRDLYAELKEGFDALGAARQGKRTLRTHQVNSKNTVRPDAFSRAAARQVLKRTEW